MLLIASFCLVLLLLLEVTLHAGGRRVHVARAALSKPSPELFGVLDMIPDWHPRTNQGAEYIDPDAWEAIREAILDRLSEVKSGLVENFCWVSHEEVLDNEARIVEGGLVVVVQKLAAFRVNFYRMEEFRSWVRVKQLDIGSNKRFADERDVWVVRLTDGSQASKTPLPRLGGPSFQGPRARFPEVTPDHLERAERIGRPDFLSSLSIPQAGQEQLIPSLSPQANEAFTFEMQMESSVMSKKWRWKLNEAHGIVGNIDLNFTRLVLSARRPRWPRRRKWTVSDASFNNLFIVQSSRDGKVHRVMTLSRSDCLYVIRVESTPRENLVEGQGEFTIRILKGDDDTVVYTGLSDEALGLMFFYRGNETDIVESIGAAAFMGDGSPTDLYVSNFTDAALLLVAIGVTFA